MSFDEIEDLLAEVLVNSDQHSAQDLLLAFLVMEPFIKQFRSQGLSNREILELCKKIDQENKI